MRIVELNPFYTPYRGGIERRIEALTLRLSRRHECFVLTSRLPGTAEEEKIAGATVIRLKSRYFGRYNPPFVRSEGVGETLESLGPDIVDYHYRWSGSYNRAFFGYKGRKVVTFHNMFGEGTGILALLSRTNDAAYVRHLKEMDVIAISDFVRRQLIDRGVNAERVHLAYNGIDAHDCTCEDMGFALFIGRLVPSKGLKYLARAAESAKIPVNVAGEGPMMKYLSGFQSIKLLGHVDEERKHLLLQQCGFLVLPSLQESFGIAALEAMAHGKPVIATLTGGLPEVVGDGGIMVPPADVKQLASAMVQLHSDPVLRQTLGKRAKKRSASFTWERTAETVEAIYTEA